jgi:hypothetical protein
MSRAVRPHSESSLTLLELAGSAVAEALEISGVYMSEQIWLHWAKGFEEHFGACWVDRDVRGAPRRHRNRCSGTCDGCSVARITVIAVRGANVAAGVFLEPEIESALVNAFVSEFERRL